jgi:hypothetical protein
LQNEIYGLIAIAKLEKNYTNMRIVIEVRPRLHVRAAIPLTATPCSILLSGMNISKKRYVHTAYYLVGL